MVRAFVVGFELLHYIAHGSSVALRNLFTAPEETSLVELGAATVLPGDATDVAELRTATTSHVVASNIQLYQLLATSTFLPSFRSS